MANADPARPVPTASSGGSELILRILSGLVLAPLAVGVAYLGGWAFVVFWGIAALLVLWEWCTLVAGGERSTVLLIAGAAVLLAILLAATAADAEGSHSVRLVAGGTLLLMGMLATAALASSDRRVWTAAGIPYAGLLGIAPIVDRSPAAARQLASRARDHVRADRPRYPVPRDRGFEIAEAFFAASRDGDMERLRALLAADVTLYADGGGKAPARKVPAAGLDDVMRMYATFASVYAVSRSRLVRYGFINGLPGFITVERGDILQTTALEIEDGRVVAVYVVRNPDKLRHMADTVH